MKKFIIGLVLSISLTVTAPTANAGLFDSFDSFSSGIGDFSSNVLQPIGGIVNQVGGIVGTVRGIFGGGGGGGGGSRPASGLFDGGEARIFEGGALGGGLNISVDNIVSSGVVVVQDFDAIFEEIQGEVGVTPTGEFVLPDPEKFNQIGENTSLRQYILNVLNFTLTFLGLIAVVFIIYAGFLYVTSGGDDGNMEKAKKIILYAIIGILVILAAFAIVNTVIQNAGRGTGDRGEIPDNTGPTGVITTTDGTIIPIIGSNDPTDPTGNSIITSTLGNLVVLSGSGVQDFGNTAVATPEAARAGVTFGLATQARALFDFGDGTQAILNTVDNAGATITHPFGEERSFPIRVIIETAQGTTPVRKELVVGGLDAKFTMNRAEVTVGEALTLDAGSTQVTVGSIKEYRWSCAGATGCFAETFGRNTSVNFSAPGEYTVTLTVENVFGVTDSFEKNIRVIGGAPLAEFSFQSARNANKPAEFVFNAGQSVNRSGNVSGLTYFWNFEGDFQQAAGPSITYEFATVGPKSVELVVVENFRGDTLRSEPIEKTVEVETVIPVDFTVE